MEKERERPQKCVPGAKQGKCQPSSWEPAKPKIKEPGQGGQADFRK